MAFFFLFLSINSMEIMVLFFPHLNCMTTKDGKRLEISKICSRGIVLCHESKGADPLRGFYTSGLRLYFRIC